MSPDREEYSLDEVALMKAGIDPRSCFGSVQYAIKKNMPGCHEASSYLEHLIEQVNSKQLQGLTYEETDTADVIGSDYIYISKEDAERWQPEAPPIQPANSEPKPFNPSGELTGKSRTSLLNLIKALCVLVSHYETKRHNPNDYPHVHIIKESGEVNAEALKRLLSEVCPDTPARADKLIIEALKKDQ